MPRITVRRSSFLFAAASLSAGLWSIPVFAQETFLEKDGVVAIEAESADTVAGWQIHAPVVANIRGQALLSTGGDSICSSNTNNAKNFAALQYRFRIAKSGTYRLRFNIHKQVHCVDVGDPSQLAACHDGAKCVSYGVQSEGDSCPATRCWRSDVSNDAFVTIATATGIALKWVGGTTDLTKFYGGSGTSYGWSGNNALDHGGSKHAPDWDLPAGDYLLEVRNRSNGFSLDRLILVEAGASDAAARNAPESEVAAESLPGTGGGSGIGGMDATGGAEAAGGVSATGGATAAGGEDATGGVSGTNGGASSTVDGLNSTDGMSNEEMMEGTGSGDDSPSANSEATGSCSWGVLAPSRSWLLASILLLGIALGRRRSARS